MGNFEKTIGTYRSSDQVSSITFYQYFPKNIADGEKPSAIVQIIHGMCEYTERYEEFIEFLTSHNIVVCGEDHLGHGKSVFNADDLGYMGEKNGNLALAMDSYILYEKMEKQYPDIPYFLFGHSMGSFILRDMLSRFSPEVSGAIICGTGGPNQPFAAGKAVIRVIRKFKGSRYRSSLANKVMFGSYCKKISHPVSVHDWLTKDAEVVKKYDADPLCNYIFTIAAMEDLLLLLERVSDKAWAGKVSAELPILLAAGEADPVGGYGEGVKEVYRRLQDAGIKDLECRLYPEDRHEVLNELDKEQVMEEFLNWMNARKTTKNKS